MSAAKLLLRIGAVSLILSSRSGRIAHDGQGLQTTLEALGSAVVVVRSDSTDRLDTLTLLGLEALKRKGGTLLVQQETAEFPNFPLAKLCNKYVTVKCARGHNYQSCEQALQQTVNQLANL